MSPICKISEENFEISDLEKSLREKLAVAPEPTMKPEYRIRHLGAFWQHWHLHSRVCDKTGKNIISPLRPDCRYPVWHKKEWVKHAQPPGAEFDFSKPFFKQAWELFQQCPIPHNLGTHSENCEYTDDWWSSKNCYLSHCGYQCEDLKYCYRVMDTKDSQFCVFTFGSELCVDLINCESCYESVYLLNCKQVQNSSFLYDCRNCQDCMFCFNLRNKQYCFGNQQLTKAEFEAKKAEWDLSNKDHYVEAKSHFSEMLKIMAWHRAAEVDRSENADGNYLMNVSNCEKCFFTSDTEDSVNVVRSGIDIKNCLDFLSNGATAELCYQTIGCGISAYNILNCCHVYNSSSFCEYSFNLERCEHCFGCCGLVGKKYHIFNKPYVEKDYFEVKEKIIAHMRQTGEYGQFFPGYFSPVPYSESWSHFYWPLSENDQKKLGYWRAPKLESNTKADNKSVFWDEVAQKPFVIQPDDVAFAEKLSVPTPYCHYSRRLQENFKWLFYNGTLRETTCAKMGKPIQTSWPVEYDGRILSEAAYLEMIV